MALTKPASYDMIVINESAFIAIAFCLALTRIEEEKQNKKCKPNLKWRIATKQKKNGEKKIEFWNNMLVLCIQCHHGI